MGDLIERLEKATGTDALLNCLIQGAHNGWKFIDVYGTRGRSLIFERPDGTQFTCRVYRFTHRNFTESTDAAMTLLPEGWRAGFEMAGITRPLRIARSVGMAV